MAYPSGDSDRLSRLLERLSDDRENAWEQYTELKTKLTKCFQQWRHAAEPSELANEVLDRVARTEDLSSIRDLESYAYGVARYLRLEVSRRNRKFLPIEEDLGCSDDPEGLLVKTIDLVKQRNCLQRCMAAWKPESYHIFHEYYLAAECDQEKYRSELAESLNITPGALAARAGRLKKKLKKCCLSCYEKRTVLVPPRDVAAGLYLLK